MFSIRQATLDDIEPLALQFNAYRVFYNQSPDMAGATDFLRQRITQQDSHIYLSETPDPLIAGFCQLYPSFSSQSMQKTWILNDLFVAPEYRSKGVAQQLIARAEKLAIDTCSKGLLLCTQTTNHIAQALYQKVGFTPLSDYTWYFKTTTIDKD